MKHKNVVCFHKIDEENGYLSNWYSSVFYVDGIQFTSVEQFIMYKKAATFEDWEHAALILETDSPDEIKRLGREVRGYVDHIWAGKRQLVLYEGLTAKFQQDTKLKKKLLATGDAVIVECSENDKIWGNGISLYDELRFNPKEWRGLNILGYTLMQVRKDILLQEQDIKPTEERGFWYETEKDGSVSLVKENGERSNFSEHHPGMDKTKQMLAGWQRAKLYMSKKEIWDATAFGAAMRATLAIYWKELDGAPAFLLFTSCQAAEETVYPFLTKKQVKQCRSNVRTFYTSKDAQLAWSEYILHPVCLLYREKTLTPISLEALYKSRVAPPESTSTMAVEIENIEEYSWFFEDFNHQGD